VRFLRLVVSSALVLGVLHATTVAASCAVDDPEDPPVSVDVPVLVLSVTTSKPRYRPRERLVVRVGARTGDPEGPKAAGAQVKVDVFDGAGVRVRTLRGQADDSGVATLVMPMPTSVRKGKLTAHVVAEKELVPHYDCRRALAYQHGERDVDPLARRA
jgi:hypothetical protein